MLPKFFAIAAFLIAFFSIGASYTQRSALTLQEEQESHSGHSNNYVNSPSYWPRHETEISGYYVGGSWQPTPARSEYSSGFRGGGPAAGK